MEVDGNGVPVRWNAWTRVQPVQFEGRSCSRAPALGMQCLCCTLMPGPTFLTGGTIMESWKLPVDERIAAAQQRLMKELAANPRSATASPAS